MFPSARFKCNSSTLKPLTTTSVGDVEQLGQLFLLITVYLVKERLNRGPAERLYWQLRALHKTIVPSAL